MKTTFYLGMIALIICLLASCGPKSGRRGADRTDRSARKERVRNSTQKTIVKMKKKDGVYFVPCKINGSEMEFIFDTGASDIVMSLTEVLFLFKQGKLKEDDFIGTQQYQIANGSIEEGTMVILHTVEIGNVKLTDVEASIVHSMDAPLLLGQSALAKFGKISINYASGEIIFE
jgi:aspartyl protease family protein